MSIRIGAAMVWLKICVRGGGLADAGGPTQDVCGAQFAAQVRAKAGTAVTAGAPGHAPLSVGIGPAGIEAGLGAASPPAGSQFGELATFAVATGRTRLEGTGSEEHTSELQSRQ